MPVRLIHHSLTRSSVSVHFPVPFSFILIPILYLYFMTGVVQFSLSFMGSSYNYSKYSSFSFLPFVPGIQDSFDDCRKLYLFCNPKMFRCIQNSSNKLLSPSVEAIENNKTSGRAGNIQNYLWSYSSN